MSQMPWKHSLPFLDDSLMSILSRDTLICASTKVLLLLANPQLYHNDQFFGVRGCDERD